MGENSKLVIESLLNNPGYYIQKIKNDVKKSTKPFKCAVVSCRNRYDKHYIGKEEHLYKFHKFPVDQAIRNRWKEQCGLLPNAKVDLIMVCSEHFNLDDYERNYKEEFRFPDYRRPLKAEAIPCLKLTGLPVMSVAQLDAESEPEEVDGGSDTEMKEIKKEEGVKKGKSKKVKNSDINTVVFKEIKTVEEATGINEVLEINDPQLAGVKKPKLSLCPILQEKEEKLKEKLASVKAELKKAHQNVYYFKKQIEKLEDELKTKQTHRHSGLYKVFSDAQIAVLKGDKKVVWTDDDLAMAFTLRHMSNRECYLYLKYTLNMPLPALSCVQKWAAFKTLVCSLHFSLGSYSEPNKLNKTAVPTLKLITSKEITNNVPPGNISYIPEDTDSEEDPNDEDNPNESTKRNISKLEEQIEAANEELARMKEVVKEKKEIMDALRTSRLTCSGEKDLLKKVFSESQIKILGGKMMAHWSSDDMMVGYTIRRMSNRRFYQHLTKTLNIPLPGLSSLTKWASSKNTREK